jgi:hypothetical protein
VEFINSPNKFLSPFYNPGVAMEGYINKKVQKASNVHHPIIGITALLVCLQPSFLQ